MLKKKLRYVPVQNSNMVLYRTFFNVYRNICITKVFDEWQLLGLALYHVFPNINIGGHYLLTPWCRVLLEKLTGLQVVKKFPAFHGTRRFITALTSVCHLSLSWASPIQSTYPHPNSWRSILILSTHLRLGLPVVSFPLVSPPRPYTPPSPHAYAPHAQPISFFSILSPAQCWVRTDHLAPRYAISSIPPLPCPSSVQIFSSTPCSQTPSASFPPSMSTTKFHTHTKQQSKL